MARRSEHTSRALFVPYWRQVKCDNASQACGLMRQRAVSGASSACHTRVRCPLSSLSGCWLIGKS